jgi:hypothetical protein
VQFVCDQDREDFEQEKRVNAWLAEAHPGRALEATHTTRHGTARNTLVRAAISLDQPVIEGETLSFADLIPGKDGRELEAGNPEFHFQEHFDGVVEQTLDALGFNEGEIGWLKTMWLRSATLGGLRSKTSTTASEWETL